MLKPLWRDGDLSRADTGLTNNEESEMPRMINWRGLQRSLAVN